MTPQIIICPEFYKAVVEHANIKNLILRDAEQLELLTDDKVVATTLNRDTNTNYKNICIFVSKAKAKQ